MLIGLLGFVVAFAVFALPHFLPPAAYGLADDWRVFYAAARLAHQGGDPYNQAAIQAAEQAAQMYRHLQPSLNNFADLPIVAWFLTPATWLSFWASFAVFTGIGAMVAAVSLRLWMRQMGWERTGFWLTGAMASWVMLLGFTSGQFDALLLGGLVASLVLMRKDLPWLAGACMIVVLLKPHLLWPLPLLLFAVWTPQWHRAWRFAMAAGLVLIGGATAGLLLVPGAGDFFTHALGFAGNVAGTQPDLSGIPGLLLPLPGGGAMGDGVAVVGAGLVAALVWACLTHHRLRDLSDAQRAVVPLVGLTIWLACVPYAHPNDDVLTFPLLVFLVGAGGSVLDARWLLRAVLGCCAVAAAFLVSFALGDALLLVGVAAWIWRRAQVPQPAVVSAALVAMMLLPTVWPFHVVEVSLTPVAVALTAVAGAWWVMARMPGADGVAPRQLGEDLAIGEASRLRRPQIPAAGGVSEVLGADA